MKRCSQCDAEMDDTETVCPQCGHGLKEQAERKRRAATQPPTIDMSDLAQGWPTMSPAARRQAIRARTMGTDKSLGARFKRLLGLGQPAPPSPKRVAARAMALAALVWRAHFEINLPDEPAAALDAARDHVFRWLKGLGIVSELEPQERDFFDAPFGAVDHALVLQTAWRCEGLAVLAWALGRFFEIPPYDEVVLPEPAQESVGFAHLDVAREILAGASLRPTPEIDRYATHATLVTWRLRTYRLSPLSWDLTAYLRGHASFQGWWFDGLRMLDGDLAIGDRSITSAPAERVDTCERSALQRHIAAYWLQGDSAVYSKVDPSTLLSAC
jgi:hypothetical protein